MIYVFGHNRQDVVRRLREVHPDISINDRRVVAVTHETNPHRLRGRRLYDDDEVIGTTRDDAHRTIDPVGAMVARHERASVPKESP